MQLAGAVGQMHSSTQHPAGPNQWPFVACRGRWTEPEQVRGPSLASPSPARQFPGLSEDTRPILIAGVGRKKGIVAVCPACLCCQRKREPCATRGHSGCSPQHASPAGVALHAASKWSPFCLLNKTDTALLIVY